MGMINTLSYYLGKLQACPPFAGFVVTVQRFAVEFRRLLLTSHRCGKWSSLKF